MTKSALDQRVNLWMGAHLRETVATLVALDIAEWESVTTSDEVRLCTALGARVALGMTPGERVALMARLKSGLPLDVS